MWILYTNHLFTRRKTFFYVVDPEGEIRFRSRWFWPCVEWLDDEEIKEYLIMPANDQGRNVKSILARN